MRIRIFPGKLRYYARRASMDKYEAKRFGEQIRHRRQELGLSTHDLGKLIGTRNSTIMRIEQGAFAAPRPDKLARIAQALHLSLADIYADAGYVVPDELPGFHAYLPARYRDLPQAAVDELSGLFDDLITRHGLETPAVVEIAVESDVSELGTEQPMIDVGGVPV
jgi:transcriptional regulator with XRE-family HTH domain